MPQPFFTIAIPTYNRHQLLRETLDSVLSQDFTDFEVIVGNDYTAEELTGELLGIADSRIRFINYPQNLQEVGNMNALLEMAVGRYFTWLFDDDLFEPGFLKTAHKCLVKTSFPPALFSSFRMLKVNEEFKPRKVHNSTLGQYSGPEFLRWYCALRPQLASTCGLFDTVRIRTEVGGAERLCSSAIGLYSEFLFLIKCGRLDRIVFIDAPFYVFRRHAESWSESNLEMDTHLEAAQELIRRSAEVLRHPSLIMDFGTNLQKICLIHIITFAHKSARYEFAKKRPSSLVTTYQALKRFHCEYVRTIKMFAAQGGVQSFKLYISFLKTLLLSNYTIVRLIAHFYSLKRRNI